jgi:hypothetical protein
MDNLKKTHTRKLLLFQLAKMFFNLMQHPNFQDIILLQLNQFMDKAYLY